MHFRQKYWGHWFPYYPV